MLSFRTTGYMDDEDFISHLEDHHPGVFADYTIRVLPGRTEREIHDRPVWERYHQRLHKAATDHDHKEKTMAKDVKKAEKKRRKHGGKPILEMIWDKLDDVMDRLMEEAPAEDGRDPGRAEAYAECIAIILNPYAPDLDAVREQSVDRWNLRQQDDPPGANDPEEQ